MTVFFAIPSCWEGLHYQKSPTVLRGEIWVSCHTPLSWGGRVHFSWTILVLKPVLLDMPSLASMIDPAKTLHPWKGEPMNVCLLKSSHNCQNFQLRPATPEEAPGSFGNSLFFSLFSGLVLRPSVASGFNPGLRLSHPHPPPILTNQHG